MATYTLVAYPSGSTDDTPKIRYPPQDTVVSTSLTNLGCSVHEFRQFGPFKGADKDTAKAEALKTRCLSEKQLTWALFETDKLHITLDTDNTTVIDVAAAASPNITKLKDDVMTLIGIAPRDNEGPPGDKYFEDSNGPSLSGTNDNGYYWYGPGTYNNSTDYGSNSLGMCAYFYWFYSSLQRDPGVIWGGREWNIVRANIERLFDNFSP